MKKPTIEQLQNFAESYFDRRCPKVKWNKMNMSLLKKNKKLYGSKYDIEFYGLADRKKNTIYLNPVTPRDIVSDLMIGKICVYTPNTRLKLREGEQYFMNLLHEIGHFKFRIKPPNEKEYVSIKRKLVRAIKKKYGVSWPMATVSMLNNTLPDCIPKKKYERIAHYSSRLAEFKSWLFGDYIVEHEKVINWAASEFKKQRKKIESILENND